MSFIKPNNVENIVIPTILNYGSIVSGGPSNLFDGLENPKYSSQTCYLNTSSYLDLQIDKRVNMYCMTADNWTNHFARLNIFKFDGNDFVPYECNCLWKGDNSNPGVYAWEKFFENIEPGIYRFKIDPTDTYPYHVAGEWCFEELSNIKYLIQDKNNNLFNLIKGDYTENLIPSMTSNTLPNGIASASSIYSSTYDAYVAFNKNYNEIGWTSNNVPSWIQYEFSKEKRIKKYTITSRNDGNHIPNSWTFEGYNEVTLTWDILDTQTNQASGLVAGTKKGFEFSNDIDYKKYRLNVDSSSSNSYISIAEIEMIEKTKDTFPNLGTLKTKQLFLDNGMNSIPEVVYQSQDSIQQLSLSLSQDLGTNGKIYETILDLSSIYNIENGNINQ